MALSISLPEDERRARHRAYDRKYAASEKGREKRRAYARKYAASEKGREKRRAYAASPDGKAALRRGQKRYQDKNRAIILAAKSAPCADCGVEYPPYVMDMHHEDPETKEFELGRYRSKSTRQVVDELAKCVALCANCHRARTFAETGEVPV